MIIVPFKADHLRALRLQPVQVMASPSTPQDIEALGTAYTALSGGEPVACGGLHELWPGRALAWTYLGVDCGAEFLALHRQVLLHVKQSPWRRVEAYVEDGHRNGHRWMKALGFELEGILRAFMADGRDMALYARVR